MGVGALREQDTDARGAMSDVFMDAPALSPFITLPGTSQNSPG